MIRKKPSLMRVILTAVAVTAACSERPDPVAPVEEPAFTAVAGSKAKVLRRTSVQASDGVVVQTVGPEGGTLSVAGVTLSIPRRALDRQVEITMTVPAGDYTQVRFAPHGLTFDRSATLSFDVSGTEVGSNPRALRKASGAYFETMSAAGEVEVKEGFTLRVTGGGRVSMEISHFSGYCVIVDRCDCP